MSHESMEKIRPYLRADFFEEKLSDCNRSPPAGSPYTAVVNMIEFVESHCGRTPGESGRFTEPPRQRLAITELLVYNRMTPNAVGAPRRCARLHRKICQVQSLVFGFACRFILNPMITRVRELMRNKLSKNLCRDFFRESITRCNR